MKVNSRRIRSQRRSCQWKEKLSLEEAPEYLLAAQKDTKRYAHPEDLVFYLCTNCQYIHIGHKLGSKKANT
jgi:hypothetical protein